MKNIIIMGTGRAGKTTTSKMLKEKYKEYNLLHSDSVKWGIIRGQGKEEYYETHIDEQKEFEHSEMYQKILLEIFKSLCDKNKDKNKYPYILESGQLSPALVNELINFDNTCVVCLGLGDFDVEDVINLCREHDVPDDWSYNIPYEDLKSHAKKWIETNEEFKKDCPKYGIKYFDTTKDREKILNEVVDFISKEIE